MTVPASLSKWAHPPRSNTPRSSSYGPPGPCITPSTETCVVVVSFMVRPFSRVQVSGVTIVFDAGAESVTVGVVPTVPLDAVCLSPLDKRPVARDTSDAAVDEGGVAPRWHDAGPDVTV